TIWGLLDYPIDTEESRYNWNPYGGLLDPLYRPNSSFDYIAQTVYRKRTLRGRSDPEAGP
ncbi:MAG: hypothetical protein IJ594_02740, partial [Oscillospiraceae bacterium]|nr:hypothetical protein [Oscillospiraceae bacterium]